MFWNTEFLNTSPSHIDVLIQTQNTKLSDILFEEDILQEIKTSNIDLTQYLIKAENLNELVDNITQLTEKDCCDKLLYSRVHAAYISCEILTACSPEIFEALLQHPDSLNKIISSLTRGQRVVPQKATLISKLISNIHSQAPADLSCHITKNLEIFSELIQVLIQNIDISGSFEILSTLISRTSPSELRYVFCEILSKLNFVDSLINLVTLSNVDDKQRNACQLLCDIIVIGRQEASEQSIDAPTAQDMLIESIESKEAVKLILTQIFSPPREISDTNNDAVKATNETVIPEAQEHVETARESDNKTEKSPPIDDKRDKSAESDATIEEKENHIDIKEAREHHTVVEETNENHTTVEAAKENHIDCEKPKENHVVVDEDKDDRADVDEGKEEGNGVGEEKEDCNAVDEEKEHRSISKEETEDPSAVDEETKNDLDAKASLSSTPEATATDTASPNTTAIICGMKVLQTLVEQKVNCNNNNDNQLENSINRVARTIERIQEEIVNSLKYFNELLLNPPKQEPIKTTFGVIQKPLGYMRLEVVNLIRALLSTHSPVIIKELVILNTMKVIIDLFIEYSWNNLLHTQVEQALCIIIRNCRHDEDLKYQIDMQKHTTNNIGNNHHQNHNELNSCDLSENNNETELNIISTTPTTTTTTSTATIAPTDEREKEVTPMISNNNNSAANVALNNTTSTDITQNTGTQDVTPNSTTTTLSDETPSRALLSQLLNECDLIGRLLLPCRNGEQANFGHIIQMINSIAINCDLDTIKDHLNDLKDRRPELYDRWTTFVNVDVASFKEISYYYDVTTVNNHIDDRDKLRNQSISYSQQNHFITSTQNNHNNHHHQTHPLNSTGGNINSSNPSANNENNVKSMNNGRGNVGNNATGSSGGGVGNDDKFFAYLSFTSETVIPSINVDVLPKSRRSTKNNNYE